MMRSSPEAPDHPGDSASSLENNSTSKTQFTERPTREYFSNFTKTELRKLCRQLGLTKVWQNKDQLIDMLLHHHRTQENAQEDGRDIEPSSDVIHKILKELQDIKEDLASKDMEIHELNVMLKSANVTINRLNDRISTLEERLQNPPTPGFDVNPETPENESTLLIGDNNLSEVRLSDLDDNCAVKTLKDTTMDLAGCWVKEKLDVKPSNCVIYCGINDLTETEDLNGILDDLGFLISELKHKNETVNIFVCELAPYLKMDIDNKISQYNDKLKDWCSVNGINLIKTNLSFRLATGEIDEMCYDCENSTSMVNLNRYGVLRLLSAISKQWDYMRLKGNMKPKHKEMRPRPHYTSHQHNRGNHSNKPNDSEGRNFRQAPEYQYSDSFRRTSRYGQRRTDSRPKFHGQSQGRPFTHDSYDMAHNTYATERNWRGCYNCGEHNHRQSNCRYDHRIRCNNCFSYGHKSRMCEVSNY